MTEWQVFGIIAALVSFVGIAYSCSKIMGAKVFAYI